jgi:PQQ-dependent dehydrogenase (methanol/ethanol family)
MHFRNALFTAAALVLLPTVQTIADTAGAKPEPFEATSKNWPFHGGSTGNTRYSTLDQINAGNVKTLGAAWSFDLKDETSKGPPVVDGGVMFVAAAGGHVTALDAKTGAVKWSYLPKGPGIDARNRGLAVGGGKVYFGLTDGSVSAIDEKTGEFAWTTYIGDGPARFGMFVSAAPTYVDGMVMSGLASGDAGIKGRFVALDAKTGKLIWQFNTIPLPGEAGHDTWPQDGDAWKNGGAGVWVNPAVDPVSGTVYFGTSNASPQYGGEVRPGDNLFTATMLALDIKTGKEKWHFQALHHDIWEGDLGTPPMLFDQTFDGKVRKAIGVLRTDGYLFVLDRDTGKPILPVEERPVPQNARLKTAPTQPYPVGVDKVGPNCVEPDLIPAGFKAGCYWEPVDFDQPNTVYPTSTRFAPMSFSPRTNLIYISGMSGGHWIRRGDDPYFFTLPSVPGMKSYGILAALDSRTGKIVWQKKTPYPIAFGSGTTATAGDLLFHGEPDGEFQAYDAKTGDKLWDFQTGAEATAPAIAYEIDGKEYVAIAATNHIWSFALGGTVAALPAPPKPEEESAFAGRIVSTDHVAMSATIESIGVIKAAKFTDEYVFQPVRIKVKAGSSVTWTNDGKVPHDASAQDGSWSTGEIAPGKSATVKFDKPGTYTYICKDHPWSYGQLVVE